MFHTALSLTPRRLSRLALCALAPLIACDTEDSKVYRAVIVDDDGIFQQHRSDNICATSSLGSHGADIDAVGLFEADGTTLIAHFTTARVKLGTACEIAAEYADPDEVVGAPNGTLTSRFVSLGGGALIGTFGDGVAIEPGQFVVVYEIGDDFCAGNPSCVGDECFHIYVATDLDCLDGDRAKCQRRVTAEDTCGQTDLTLSGF